MSLITFPLQIITREGVVFNQEVQSITSYNSKGRFDILPHHVNYICIIENKLIIKDANGKVQEFTLYTGLLQVVNNSGKIFLGFKK